MELPEGGVEQFWMTGDGWPIRRIDLAPRHEARGSLLFMPGRGDFYEKYLESLSEWRDAGWHVTSLDWRGQAGSGRLGMDDSTGHSDDFGIWVDDLAAFWAQWRKERPGPIALIGHSMGGYGASRIGMKHADVFGALYLMSPCCLSARGLFGVSPEAMQAYAAMKSPADSAGLPWAQRGTLAAAAAWSPNPKNPPLYLDLPMAAGPAGDYKPREDVLAKWAANAPLSFVDQYIGQLRRYSAIAMDVGDKDGLKADTARLHDVLDSYGIANSFTVYEGDHTNRVAFRFQEQVVPFFSQHLVSGKRP